MDFNKIIKKQEKMFNITISNQEKNINKTIKKQEKDIKKLSNIQIKQLISKEGRIRIPAKRRHEVKDKYKNKCAKCKRTHPLQIHHNNGKNNDNKLSNLVLLCANCHYDIHSKGSKLNKTIRKRSVRRSNSLNWGI